MFYKILISVLALLWELLIVLGFIVLFYWLWRGFRDMVRGKGPGRLPWL